MLTKLFTFVIQRAFSFRFLAVLIIVLLASPACSLAVNAPDDTENTKIRYQAAKDYYYELERNEEEGKIRNNWLEAVRNFRRIYLAETKGPLAPSCLYMMGRLQYKMFQRFNLPIDLESALGYFNDVSTIFPVNKLADDALYAVGEMYYQDKHNQQKAAEKYLKIIQQYPNSDKHAKARDRLQKLQQTTDIILPDAPQKEHKQPKSRLVQVLPVKYWSTDSYTRIVIRSSAPVHFTADLLEKTEGQPRRLYVDFSPSYIPPKYRSPVPIDDGLLKQIRTGQHNDSTVRVVLDIESISDYKIFSLEDPFRVVVDVHGDKSDDKKSTVSAQIASPEHDQPVEQIQKKPATKRPSLRHAFVTLRDNKKKKAEAKVEINRKTRVQNYSLAQQLGLGVSKIVIDPGHGGKDPGATANGLKEKDIVLAIAKKIGNVLESTYGYEVAFTRTKDIFIPLEERTAIANTLNADLFLSIHINAHQDPSLGGIETYYLNLATNAEAMRVAAYENATSPHNINEMQDILSTLMQNSKIDESSRLADAVHAQIITGLDGKYAIRDMGVKQAPFYVLIGAEMPAILAELSFITNKREAQLLQTQAYQHLLAKQIAAGVVNYVNTTTALKNYCRITMR
ncbi:MAG: hypothetical protein CSA31_00305 [Desulfobulbus propionicus]|nr:MAG: hypothetical protein CSA31_00305 [Desulfobulbus propionicus]